MSKLFLTSSANTVMHDVVKHFHKPLKGLKVAFIDTASETERGSLPWLDADRDVLIELGFNVFDYTLTGRSHDEVLEALSDIDILFVAGGNTFHLLQQANKCDFKKIVNKLLDAGVMYIGSSAGSVLACSNTEPIKFLDDPSVAKDLRSYEALALVDFFVFPHWGTERSKEKRLKSIESIYSQDYKVILLTDKQYILVEDDKYKIFGLV